MKALVYNGPESIGYEDFKDPVLAEPRDMLVRIGRCGICGSDLHIYHGSNPATPEITRSAPGYCVGHEAIGEVVHEGRDACTPSALSRMSLRCRRAPGRTRCLRNASTARSNSSWTPLAEGTR